MQIGELATLWPANVDLEKKLIVINTSHQWQNGKDIITPKTLKSNRVVTILDNLCACLGEYIDKCYDLQDMECLFLFTKFFIKHEMDKNCKKSNVKHIRMPDLRHNRASLLIDIGFSPLLIAERLRHEKIETTLERYRHFYPNK
jgi:integrase